MFKPYNINLSISANFNEFTINAILQKGQMLNFCFFTNDKHTTLDIKEVHEQMLNIPKINFWVRLEDTFFILSIAKESQNIISINIGPSVIIWKKIFDIPDYGYIDFARYIRLLLSLCENFAILKIQIYNEALMIE